MKFRCPECNSSSCVDSAEHVLETASKLYVGCGSCNDLDLEKTDTINLTHFDFDELKCTNCGKRPLDAVMAHILSLSVRHKDKPDLTLRQVGTPLLSPGVPIYARPHIGSKHLVLLTKERIIAAASKRILTDVPEVKAVIYGSSKEIFGLAHSKAKPRTCRVLAGCALRGDLVTSAYGQLLIYRSQSKIHIEHNNALKMAKLGILPVAGRVVLDALAGPGTLGLVSVLMGAQKVILNDAWLPAVENAYLNLKMNRKILGIRSIRQARVASGLSRKSPVLFGEATTNDAIIELYYGEFERFNIQDTGVNLLLFDPFPGTEPHFQTLIGDIRRKHPEVQIACF